MSELLSLTRLAMGGITEQVDHEMAKVIENIQDINTEATAKRKMTIILTFEPSQNRNEAQINVVTKLLLAPISGISTRIYMEKDEEGGIYAGELLKGTMPGQQTMTMDGEVDNKIYKIK